MNHEGRESGVTDQNMLITDQLREQLQRNCSTMTLNICQKPHVHLRLATDGRLTAGTR